MKIKHFFSFLYFSIFLSTTAFSQGQCNQYFQLEKGTTWTTMTKGTFTYKDGKKTVDVNLKRSYEVDKVKEKDGVSVFSLTVKNYSPNGKRVMLTSKDELYCKNGDYLVSVLDFLFTGSDMGAVPSVELAQKGFVIPSDLEGINSFEDISTEYIFKSAYPGAPKTPIKLEVTERKVEGKEEITTPLGSLTTFKLSSIVQLSSKDGSLPGGPFKLLEYIAPKYGFVRRESYSLEGEKGLVEEITEFQLPK